jgi:hypothetical protein
LCEIATIAELAKRTGIASAYLTLALRLTLLAPDTLEAVPDGRLGPDVTRARVLMTHPIEWTLQPDQLEQTV